MADSSSSAAASRLQRKLCAVLAADVAGYTRLMEADEEGTHRRLMRLRAQQVAPGVARWRGRVVKNTGDGFLAAFDSVLDATNCAVYLQKTLHKIGSAEPHDRRLAFRMGLTLADTIVEADDIYGEGVNIAARLQSYAEPGGIVVQASVAQHLEGKLDVRRVDLGDLHLKNISRPVRAYSLEVEGQGNPPLRFSARTPDLRPSIAVLPFRKQLVREEDGYFADGIVDDIIRVMSGLKDLVVIARASTLGFDNARIDAGAIGRELGVHYILNGGVARAGGRIRITTELSDTASGTIIWAERYDGDASDLFELQDHISLRVAATLVPQIREHELRRVLRKHPESMDAYDLVLQAINLLYRMEYKDFSRARGLLLQAIALDDQFAPAWAYAAQWYHFRIGQGWYSDLRANLIEAARLAEAAIERDGNDAAALAICGHTQSFLLRDYDAGASLLDRALLAGPSCALAWNLASCTSSYIGEGAEAVTRAETSLRLSPCDPLAFFYICNLGIAHYACGAYEEAVRCGRRSAAAKKTFRANLRTLAASLVALGQLDEARSVGAMLMEVDPAFRLTSYRDLCPWRDADTRGLFVDRLRQAGLPD
jgi:adenylate cyclase